MRNWCENVGSRTASPSYYYLVTFVVMTYPFVFRMHDSLAIHNTDTFKALWQNWWLREALIRGYDINFADIVFHPQGLNLSLDPRRWTTFPIWTILYTVFGDPLAYNLVAMSGVLFKAYGMYLFCVMLFRQRIPAWVAGAFFAFAAPALRTSVADSRTPAPLSGYPGLCWPSSYGLSRVRCKLAAVDCVRIWDLWLAGMCFSLNHI